MTNPFGYAPTVESAEKMASYLGYFAAASSAAAPKKRAPQLPSVAAPPAPKRSRAVSKAKASIEVVKNIDPSKGAAGGPPVVRGQASAVVAETQRLSKPLYVDCSVEYELPMVPKIPPDSQPLLVIHPGWQQKRRITRSVTGISELQQRQYFQYCCAQCPAPQQSQQRLVSSAASAPSRKRPFEAAMMSAQQQYPCCYEPTLTGK